MLSYSIQAYSHLCMLDFFSVKKVVIFFSFLWSTWTIITTTMSESSPKLQHITSEKRRGKTLSPLSVSGKEMATFSFVVCSLFKETCFKDIWSLFVMESRYYVFPIVHNHRHPDQSELVSEVKYHWIVFFLLNISSSRNAYLI